MAAAAGAVAGVAVTAGTSGMPPPAPDRRRLTAILALALITAVLVLTPGPFGAASAAVTTTADADPGGSRPPSGPGRAWPAAGPSGILRRFDAPPVRWAAGHRGVDLAIADGEVVRAAAAGVIAFSGMVAGRAVVTVEHPGTGVPPLRTTYLPVAGSLPVGTAVSAGEIIGRPAPGAGHCAAGCLHWGLLRGERYLDPLALLGARSGPATTAGRQGRHPLGAMVRAAIAVGASGRGLACRQPVQGQLHGGIRDGAALVLRRALGPLDRGLDHSLQQRGRQPWLLVAELPESVHHQRDQPGVGGSDPFTRGVVELQDRDRGDRAVPRVPGECQLTADVGLDLAEWCGAGGHPRLDLGRPEWEVTLAELLDDIGTRAEVLVDRGAGEPGPRSQRGEGESLRPAFGQQRARGIKEGCSLQLTMLGQSGCSDLRHPPTLRRPHIRRDAGTQTSPEPARPGSIPIDPAQAGAGQHGSAQLTTGQRRSASFARSWRTDLVWIWQILLSVTPSTWPISASVSPS